MTVSPNPRTCVGCRRKDVRENLVRIAARDSAAEVDEQATIPGRGAWIHPDPGCLNRANRAHAFERALRAQNLDMTKIGLWLESIVSRDVHDGASQEAKKAGRNPMGTR